MRNFQGTLQTLKPSFISALSICMNVPLNGFKIDSFQKKVPLVTFSSPEMTFFKNSADSASSF